MTRFPVLRLLQGRKSPVTVRGISLFLKTEKAVHFCTALYV
jgi:hypothetical protein